MDLRLNQPDRSEYRLPESFRWPGGKKIACIFRTPFEGWADDSWPKLSPMGNPLKPGYPDLNARAWADYGHRRGIFRVLEVYARNKIRGAFTTNGIMIERFPDIVRQIDSAGHEIVGHSYTMDQISVYMTKAQERENIRHNQRLAQKVLGKPLAGWANPRGTPSLHTSKLLAEEGFLWQGDTLNEDLPFLVSFGKHSIVQIPNTMEVNDLPLIVKHGQSPKVFVEVFQEWLDWCRKYERGAVKIDPTIHSHVGARPANIWAFERVMQITNKAKDIWIGSRFEMAAHVRKFIAQEQMKAKAAGKTKTATRKR
jgi:peptidoglycan/xylan/chitin deacetylase (PgdA/CDA1 family)